MTAWYVAGCIGTVITLATFLYGALRWTHTKIADAVVEAIGPVAHEVTPNSGQSMKDTVNRIDTQLAVNTAAINDMREAAERNWADIRTRIDTQSGRIDNIIFGGHK